VISATLDIEAPVTGDPESGHLASPFVAWAGDDLAVFAQVTDDVLAVLILGDASERLAVVEAVCDGVERGVGSCGVPTLDEAIGHSLADEGDKRDNDELHIDVGVFGTIIVLIDNGIVQFVLTLVLQRAKGGAASPNTRRRVLICASEPFHIFSLDHEKHAIFKSDSYSIGLVQMTRVQLANSNVAVAASVALPGPYNRLPWSFTPLSRLSMASQG
jgi:hypothetical protein